MAPECTPLTPSVRHGLHPELRDVATRLHAEFDDRLGASTVDRVLDEVAGRFAGAPVRSFVPLLVHRYARHALGSGAAATEVPVGARPDHAAGAAVSGAGVGAGWARVDMATNARGRADDAG
jgi:hypothetical protein